MQIVYSSLQYNNSIKKKLFFNLLLSLNRNEIILKVYFKYVLKKKLHWIVNFCVWNNLVYNSNKIVQLVPCLQANSTISILKTYWQHLCIVLKTHNGKKPLSLFSSFLC